MLHNIPHHQQVRRSVPDRLPGFASVLHDGVVLTTVGFVNPPTSSSSNWCFGDALERIADLVPAAPALQHGAETTSWAQFGRRADGVAASLLNAGLAEQDKVAQYLYNCPEYLESVFACTKAGLVPVNTNYRYVDDELVYLWLNADVSAVVFHGTFTATVERVRARLPQVRAWLWVDDEAGACPSFAIRYEDVATAPTDRVLGGC